MKKARACNRGEVSTEAEPKTKAAHPPVAVRASKRSPTPRPDSPTRPMYARPAIGLTVCRGHTRLGSLYDRQVADETCFTTNSCRIRNITDPPVVSFATRPGKPVPSGALRVIALVPFWRSVSMVAELRRCVAFPLASAVAGSSTTSTARMSAPGKRSAQIERG